MASRKPKTGRSRTSSGGSRASRASAGMGASAKKKRAQAPAAKVTRKSVRASSASSSRASRKQARSSSRAEKKRTRELSRDGASSSSRAAHGSGEQALRHPKTKAQLRAEERERRTKSAYKGYVLRILIGIVLVLAVIFGAIFLYRSDAFHVENVTVSGVSHLTDHEITRIAAVPDDSTLLRLDEDGIKQRLSQNAWVQSVEVKRVFPDTVELDIVEREPAAAVRVNEKSTWVVADDGAWLSAATNADWEKDPRIVDVNASISAPVSGVACDDEGIMNALKVVAALGERTKGELDTISAPSAAKTSLNLKNGVSVAFGDASEVAAKEAAIWGILDKLSGQVSYINVRVPSRPTYRALGADDAQANQDSQNAAQQEQTQQEQQGQEAAQQEAAQQGQTQENQQEQAQTEEQTQQEQEDGQPAQDVAPAQEEQSAQEGQG